MDHRVLIIGPDQTFRGRLKVDLAGAGYRVLEAADPEMGMRMHWRERPEIVLLDIQTAGGGGYRVCQDLRARSTTTAILMMAAGDEHPDHMEALRAGADGCLDEPYRADDMLGRLQALLRHSSHEEQGIQTGAFRLEFYPPRCFHGAESIDLTPKEAALLSVFLLNPGRVLGREQLWHRVWGPNHQGSAKALDVYIRRLREKIEQNPSRPIYLQTIWGQGYRWDEI